MDGVDLAALTPAQGVAVSRSGLPGDEGGPGGGGPEISTAMGSTT